MSSEGTKFRETRADDLSSNQGNLPLFIAMREVKISLVGKEKFSLSLSTLAMPIIIAFALLFRIILIFSHWPDGNSDIATIALMAMHIVNKGEVPVFFYGQGYMGALQAYLGAIAFRLFGMSFISLHIATLFLFSLYLLTFYFLIRLLYTKKFALLMIFILSLGSEYVMVIPIGANGGYAETMFFGVAIFLLATRIALNAKEEKRVSRRLILYGVFGLTSGLALWSDHLILPAIGTAGLLLCICCPREICGKSGLVAVSGFLVALIPVFLYNIAPPAGQDTLHAIGGTFSSGATLSIPFWDRILHTFFISLPVATGMPFVVGAGAICPTYEPYTAPLVSLGALFPDSSSPVTCLLLRGGWSVVVIVLWCLAVSHIFLWLRGRWSSRRQIETDNATAWRERVIYYARFMILLSACLWLILFIRGEAAATVPLSSSRYLVCLLFAIPGLLWSVWQGSQNLWQRERPRQIFQFVIGGLNACILLAVIAFYSRGSLEVVAYASDTSVMFQQREQLTQELLRLHATRVYTEYWTCNPLIFLSQERIICSSLDEDLQPGLDRYLPYRKMVQAAENPVYVFPVSSPQNHIFAKLRNAHSVYEVIIVNKYAIYYKRN
jgi:hypothetical protein